ncbi:19833_t:CDS:2, partial [Cetraspora pellucida]
FDEIEHNELTTSNEVGHGYEDINDSLNSVANEVNENINENLNNTDGKDGVLESLPIALCKTCQNLNK